MLLLKCKHPVFRHLLWKTLYVFKQNLHQLKVLMVSKSNSFCEKSHIVLKSKIWKHIPCTVDTFRKKEKHFIIFSLFMFKVFNLINFCIINTIIASRYSVHTFCFHNGWFFFKLNCNWKLSDINDISEVISIWVWKEACLCQTVSLCNCLVAKPVLILESS